MPSNKPTGLANLILKPTNVADNVLDIKLKASHTGKALRLLNSAGTVLWSVDASGNITGAGIVQTSASQDTHNYAGGFVPAANVSGTDTAGIATKIWVSELFIPANQVVTGVSFLIGSVGGTDNKRIADGLGGYHGIFER